MKITQYTSDGISVFDDGNPTPKSDRELLEEIAIKLGIVITK